MYKLHFQSKNGATLSAIHELPCWCEFSFAIRLCPQPEAAAAAAAQPVRHDAPTPAKPAAAPAAAPGEKDEVTDLKEQVAFLLAKRSDDKQRIKELEKSRLQLHQVCLL